MTGVRTNFASSARYRDRPVLFCVRPPDGYRPTKSPAIGYWSTDGFGDSAAYELSTPGTSQRSSCIVQLRLLRNTARECGRPADRRRTSGRGTKPFRLSAVVVLAVGRAEDRSANFPPPSRGTGGEDVR